MPKTNSNLPTQDELKVQGSNLAKQDAKETKSLQTKTTKVVRNTDSLDYQLGKLQSDILKLENVKIISKELAKKYSINRIDRRRRSESLWLFNNFSEVNSWLNKTKKRFISITSLKFAFDKANKPKTSEKSKDEPKVQDEPKAQEEVSNVGQSEPKVQKKLSVSDIALEVLVQLEIHGISAKDFAREFNSQYKELKQVPVKKAS
tara:strand:- start:596 stop:1207 length:612 start_codon:yes stop_codon:yes gene_type:complete